MNTTAPPFLIADTSAWSGPNPNLEALVDDPQVSVVILKAYQPGVNDGGWFAHGWRKLAGLGGMRGSYCYLDLSPTAKPGAVQAEGYLRAIQAAGGWIAGRDILPMLDAERGKPTSRAYNVSRAQVEDTVSSAALRLRVELGRPVMYYGRGVLRDLKITSRMDCDFIMNSGATWPMPKTGLKGIPIDDIVGWQYAADGKGSAMAPLQGYPLTVVAFGQPSALDMGVFIDGRRVPNYEAMVDRLILGLHASASPSSPIIPTPGPMPATTSIQTVPAPFICPAEPPTWSNTKRLLLGLGIATGAALAVAAYTSSGNGADPSPGT